MEGQYDRLRQQYPQDVSLKELEAELKAAQKTRADLEKALAQGDDLRRAVSDGEAKFSQWEGAEEEARKALEEARTKAVKAGETQAHLEAELPEAYRDPRPSAAVWRNWRNTLRPTKKIFSGAATTWYAVNAKGLSDRKKLRISATSSIPCALDSGKTKRR